MTPKEKYLKLLNISVHLQLMGFEDEVIDERLDELMTDLWHNELSDEDITEIREKGRDLALLLAAKAQVNMHLPHVS